MNDLMISYSTIIISYWSWTNGCIGLMGQDAVELSTRQIELYHMEIHRNKEGTVPVTSDLTKGQSAAQVVFDETLHVRTWIDGGIQSSNLIPLI